MTPTVLTWARGPVRLDLCPVVGPRWSRWDVFVSRIVGGRILVLTVPRAVLAVRWSRGARW